MDFFFLSFGGLCPPNYVYHQSQYWQQSAKSSSIKAVFRHWHNGAVFRHLVPNLKICSHSINQAHVHCCEIMDKVLGNQYKTCTNKDPVPNLVPKNKVSNLYMGTDTVPEF